MFDTDRVSVRKLPSGITLIVDPTPGISTTIVTASFDCGSRRESIAEEGLAHLVEHCATLSTMKLGHGKVDDLFDEVGGESNAATTPEEVLFYATVPAEEVDRALFGIAEIVGTPAFEEALVEREKGVVCSEIDGYDTVPGRMGNKALAAFYPNQRLGSPIYGSREAVRSFSVDQVRRYHFDHCKAGNAVVSVIGAVRDVEEVTRRVEGEFGGRLPSGHEPWDIVQARHLEASAVVLVADEDEPEVDLSVLFPAPSQPDEEARLTALSFLMIFGTGTSSRLFHRMRREQGLCYHADASMQNLRDTGWLSVSTAFHPSLASRAAAVITEELSEFASKGPTDEEMRRVKAKLRAGMNAIAESKELRTMVCIGQIRAHGRLRHPREIEEALTIVTRDNVTEFAQGLLSGPSVIGVCGPEAACRETASVLQGTLG